MDINEFIEIFKETAEGIASELSYIQLSGLTVLLTASSGISIKKIKHNRNCKLPKYNFTSKNIKAPKKIILSESIETIENDILPECPEEVQYFYKILKENFSEKELEIFLNNIRTLRIINASKLQKKKMAKMAANGVEGYYKYATNSIKLGDIKEVVYHELFHMASSNSNGRIGFQYYTHGRLLNEGYTELMSHRYFEDKMPYATYHYAVDIMKAIEEIVGKEKMEKMYLSGDFLALLNELEKYATKDDIEKFIINTDAIYKLMYDIPKEQKEELVKDLYNDEYILNSKIKDFIQKCRFNKIKLMYASNEIPTSLRNNLPKFIEDIDRQQRKVGNKSIMNKIDEDIMKFAIERINGEVFSEEISYGRCKMNEIILIKLSDLIHEQYKLGNLSDPYINNSIELIKKLNQIMDVEDINEILGYLEFIYEYSDLHGNDKESKQTIENIADRTNEIIDKYMQKSQTMSC